MPVAEFPGARGWGYDGVYLSAAQSSYGGPEGLARLVGGRARGGARRGAGRGLQPRRRLRREGARGLRPLLHREVRDRRGAARSTTTTPSATRCASGCSRAPRAGCATSASTACAWTPSTRSCDSSAEHVVAGGGAARARAEPARAGDRRESGLNDPRVVRPPERGGWGCDAAWADDFHHALRVLLTGDRDGYYAEFGSMAKLAKAFHRPHVHDGGYSSFRRRRFGAPAEDVPAGALRRLLPEPRPGGQPGLRRPPAASGAAARRVLHVCFRLHADAVHGRGVRRERRRSSSSPTTSTRRSPRPRARAAGASSRRSPVRRGGPGPAGRRPRSRRSKLTRERDPELSRLYCRAAERPPPAPARRRRRDRLRRRGALAAGASRRASELVCNFADRPARVPCAGWRACSLRRTGSRGSSDGHVELGPLAGALIAVTEVWPGRPFPLGAEWDGSGTNFSLFSEHAERVELCLFDDHDNETRVELTERTALNWHCYLPGVGPGQRYGYRVHGPVRAGRGQPLQQLQAADRPLREGDRRRGALGGGRERPALRARPATRTPTSRPTTRTTRPPSRSRW